jgi:flavin reductase (DIM6/NTAB) family NADH-FMN oxidoreductase RutF
VNVVTAGDHDIVIGEVLHADCLDGDPLVFYCSQYRSLG